MAGGQALPSPPDAMCYSLPLQSKDCIGMQIETTELQTFQAVHSEASTGCLC